MKKIYKACYRSLRNIVFIRRELSIRNVAFTLVEMLMALLIVSVILSASLPVISQRTKSRSDVYSKYSAVPVGMIAMWKADGALPDNTWLEANGQVIPNGIEYEQCRRIFGSRLPDLRGTDSEFYTSLNNYLSKDIKDYLQSAVKPIPKDFIGIWGTTAPIPEGWSEAKEYAGYFLRGYGTTPAYTQSWNDTSGTSRSATTVYKSADIGAVQGDAIRIIAGSFTTDAYAVGGVFSGIYWGKADVFWSGGTPMYLPNFDSSRVIPTSSEIRPVNKAVRYIKYTNAPSLPDLPNPPAYIQRFRYIVKVRN